MKLVVKAVLYVAFVLLAVMSLQRVRLESSRPTINDRRMGGADPAVEGVPVSGSGGLTATNQLAESTNAIAASGLTNSLSEAAATNAEAASLPPAGAPTPVGSGNGSAKKSGLGGGIAGFMLGLLGLAGLIGWDVTQFFAGRANRVLGVEIDAPKEKAAEYEAAEEMWTKGNHLDAVTMMRDYLVKNPSEQYVALRIAEIYEKDLGNYLAAALEYEEILNRNLPREKWGWTALRLSNLYSGRLNQADKAIGVLERVIADYSETAAAKKARERLGIPEPTDEPVGEMDVNPVAGAAKAAGGESADPTLPSGFRRKK